MQSAFFNLFRRTRPAPAALLPGQWHAPCGSLLTLRPSVPADAALLGGLLDGGLLDGGQQNGGLSLAARRNRFHGSVGRLSAQRLAWLAGADFTRHVAFIVTCHTAGADTAVAEGRWVRLEGQDEAEFALSVADAWQGCGVGRRLLAALVGAARQRGLRALVGDVLPTNQAMQALAESLQFSCAHHPDDAGLLRATLALCPARRGRLSGNAWLH